MSITTVKSPDSVRATADRAVLALERRGIELFARIDHGGGARSAGLELADEEVLIFGDPRAGTPLMQSDPRIGYELPLRLLIWDGAGTTLVGYRKASELAAGYAVEQRAELLERMDGLLEQLATESASPS